MSPSFLLSVRNSPAFSLICEGKYAEAAQALEEQLPADTDFTTTFEAYASVLMVSDAFDRLIAAIGSWNKRILEHQATAGLSAAILQLFERSEEALVFSERFKTLGGSPAGFHAISAYVAQTSGRPELQLDQLLKRAFLPGVEKNTALLKYLNVCLQYGEFDRAMTVRRFVNGGTGSGPYIEGLLDALSGDRTALLKRVNNWLSDPSFDARSFVWMESLWSQAGIPELFEPTQRAAERWHDDPRAISLALSHHFVRLKGSDPSNSPVVEKLNVGASNYIPAIIGSIDHGYFDNALNLIDNLKSLHADSNRSHRESLAKLITRMKSIRARREIIVDRPDLDWLLSKPADPGKLCIVFTGLNGQMGIGGVRILDRFLASLGYQVLYVRDFNRLAFANGIVSKGSDKSAALAAMMRLIEECESQDPVVIGASRGSAAAIEYGLNLKARRILTFGYQGWRNNNDRWRIGDARAALFNVRFKKQIEGQLYSLQDYMDRASHDFQIDMFYQRLNLVDAYHARSVQPSNKLRIRPLNGSMSHSCLRTLMQNDSLKQFL